MCTRNVALIAGIVRAERARTQFTTWLIGVDLNRQSEINSSRSAFSKRLPLSVGQHRQTLAIETSFGRLRIGTDEVWVLLYIVI